MARALELLKPEVPPGLIPQFLRWVNTQLMPQMDYFVTESDLGALHSNFHAAIVDAMAAVAVLSNDRVRWDKAREVFDVTVRRYLRWGKDEWAVDHVLGECTETQRDIFHSQVRPQLWRLPVNWLTKRLPAALLGSVCVLIW
jgi:hypothetical protein